MNHPKIAGDKLRPSVGVGVAVVKDGKILLGKRKNAHAAGTWAFPGGHLEFGESVEQCAERELFEETGLRALSLSLGPWVNNLIEVDKHYVTLFVFVNAFAGNLQLLEPHKCEGWQWFEWNVLPSPLFPSIPKLIEKIGLEKLVLMGCPEKSSSLHF